MNQQTFRRQWLRSHRAYEKRAYRILKNTFRALGNSIPFDQLTNVNYPSVIWDAIPERPIYDAYIQIYLQIGIIHGNRIGKGINKDIKEFTASQFEENFRRYVYVWMRDTLGFRITSVRQEYIKYIIALIDEGRANNKTILEISKDITKLINQRNWYGWQSLRIARTESTSAANLSAIQAGNASGVVWEKVWISATDNRVRRPPKSHFDHFEMNGKTVLKGDFFDVNGERIEFPGAQMTQHGRPTSAGNIINCRCAVAVRARRDRHGRIIRTA